MYRLLLPLLMLTSSLLYAQTDTSYRLIWYKGKKINDTTLLTTSGRRIVFSPRSSTVTVNIPDAKNIFLPVIKGIKKNEQRREDIAGIITRHPKKHCLIITIPVINRVFDRIEDLTAEWSTNKVELTPRDEVLSPALTESWKDLPAWVEVEYAEIKEYLKKVYTKSGISDPPPPPDVDFDYCFPCDSARQQTFRHESQVFMDTYLGEEKKYLDKITDILHYFAERRYERLPYDTASARKMEPELMAVVPDIGERIEFKMKELWFKYNRDVKKLAFLMDQISIAIHNNQLLGRDPDADFPSFQEIGKHAVDLTVKYIDKVSKERDYRVILNLDWILEIFRIAEVLNISNTLPLDKAVMDFANNVRFKIKTDSDATLSAEESMIHAKLTGENTFIAVADADCKLRWKLMGPDTAKMVHKLEEAKMRAADKNPAYIGTKNFVSNPANLKLDFCNEENRDSALFYSYFTKGREEEKWEMPEGQIQPSQTIRAIFMIVFTDKKRMEDIANDPAFQAELQQKMEAKKKEIQAAQEKMQKSGTLDARQLHEINNMMRAAQNMIEDYIPMLNLLIRGHLKNFEKLVFDQTLDGKTLFNNEMIEHAFFKVKIEHVEEN